MSKRISLSALFTAFAVILSYIETFIPVVGIPGVKLGLANLVIILAMYMLGTKEAITINVIRILIIGMFFGNLFSIAFSISGGLISFLVMYLMKKTNKFTMVTIGIFGGVSHNMAQLIIAAFVVSTYGILTYLPVLILSGLITGLAIGIVSNIIFIRTKNIIKREKI